MAGAIQGQDERQIIEAKVFTPTKAEYQDLNAYLPQVVFAAMKREDLPCCVIKVPDGCHIRFQNLQHFKDAKTLIPVHFQKYTPIGTVGFRVLRKKDPKTGKQVERMMPVGELLELAERQKSELLAMMDVRPGDPKKEFTAALFRLAYKNSPITKMEFAYGENMEEINPISPRECNFNLNVWPLRFSSVEGNIPGVTTPTTYIASMGSTFPLHTEGSHLYAANLQLEGETKIWWVAHPGDFGTMVEMIKKTSLIDKRKKLDVTCRAFWSHQCILMNPEELIKNSVRIYRIEQEAGQMVLLLPKAFHQGTNLGSPFNHSVNFTGPDWLAAQYAGNICPRDCPWRKGSDDLYRPSDEALANRMLTSSVQSSLVLNKSVNDVDPALFNFKTHKICCECLKVFKSKKNRNEHMVTHLSADERKRPYQCAKCPLNFLRPAHLDRHVKGVHTLLKFKCLLCAGVFTRDDTLQRHMVRKHSGKKGVSAVSK